MGCNSSVNIQVEENNGNRIIKANDRIIENKNKTNNNNNISQKKNKFDDDNAEYMDIDTAKKTLNENSESKVLENNTIKISKIQNLNINKNLYNYKSTNFKYEKDEHKNLLKSNPVSVFNNEFPFFFLFLLHNFYFQIHILLCKFYQIHLFLVFLLKNIFLRLIVLLKLHYYIIKFFFFFFITQMYIF